MYIMSILCSTADAVSSCNWFIVFKVLTLKFAMLIKLGLGLGSVADFLNTGSRASTSAEHAPFFT